MDVALTFDAEDPERRSDSVSDDAIMSILHHLRRAGIRATFFAQGGWVESKPGLARAIAAQDHLIGNHSHSHADMTLLSEGDIREEVRSAEEAIERHIGVTARPWFRLPYGRGEADARVIGALAGCGYRHVSWDVDPKDWDPSVSARTVVNRVVRSVHRRSGPSVVLLHAWSRPTAKGLPSIIRRLRRRGAEFVAVDALAPEE